MIVKIVNGFYDIAECSLLKWKYQYRYFNKGYQHLVKNKCIYNTSVSNCSTTQGLENLRKTLHCGGKSFHRQSPFVYALCQSYILKKCFSTQTKLSLVDKELQKYLKNVMLEYEQLQCSFKPEIIINLSPEEKDNKNKKMQTILPIVEVVNAIQEKKKELNELVEFIAGLDEKSDDLLNLAKKDEQDYLEKLSHLEAKLFDLLLPDFSLDNNDIILEVQAGVGGQEAMLFAMEIFEMYINYTNWKKWKYQLVHYDKSDLGGLRHGSAIISGLEAYRYFKFEGGIHRVQRVPKTEKSGRIHTSTVTVAVLPQPEEIDIILNPKDLKIETSRSSGKGGQSVNTTDSCVRIVHLPTEIWAECQQERSQLKNKEMAMKTLRARLFEKQLDEQMQKMKSNRKLQVGSSGRSEKIRTYNFNQDRITDHRIGECLYNLNQFLLGGEGLDSMIKLLLQEERKEKIIEVLTSITEKCN